MKIHNKLYSTGARHLFALIDYFKLEERDHWLCYSLTIFLQLFTSISLTDLKLENVYFPPIHSKFDVSTW